MDIAGEQATAGVEPEAAADAAKEDGVDEQCVEQLAKGMSRLRATDAAAFPNQIGFGRRGRGGLVRKPGRSSRAT